MSRSNETHALECVDGLLFTTAAKPVQHTETQLPHHARGAPRHHTAPPRRDTRCFQPVTAVARPRPRPIPLFAFV
jgi:hypothetical protein